MVFAKDKKYTAGRPYAVSQCGWRVGRHEMLINVVDHDLSESHLGIGIVTNPAGDVSGGWMMDSKAAGDCYQFYLPKSRTTRNGYATGIYETHNGKSKLLEQVEVIPKGDGKQSIKGADIGLVVDCDQWTVAFTFNQKQVGNIINVQPATFYAAIEFSSWTIANKSFKYHLSKYV